MEYACHVRDVLLAQREGLFLTLVEECPSFAPICRDQRVVFARYADEEPERVADQFDMAAMLAADALEQLDENAWSRECINNFPCSGETNRCLAGRTYAARGRTSPRRPRQRRVARLGVNEAWGELVSQEERRRH